MSTKYFLLICALLSTLVLAACGSGGGEKATLAVETGEFPDPAVFNFTPAEQAAFEINDDSSLTVEFGDPSLGQVFSEAPPSPELFAQLTGDKSVSGAKGNYCKKHQRKNCKKCPCTKHQKRNCGRCNPCKTHKQTECSSCNPCEKHSKKNCGRCNPCKPHNHPDCNVCNPCEPHGNPDCNICNPPPPTEKCLQITGVCNLTERFVKVDDCCDTAADVTYVAQVTFDSDDPLGDRSGIEVIFSRDGQEVGRADTNAEGIATFVDSNVSREPHQVTVCVAEGRTGDCTDGGSCKDTRCPSKKQNCEPTIDVVFTATTATATSSKDLSNVVIKYCDGSTQKFDGLSGKTGTFFGSNANLGKPVAGVWVKSGCNSSGDGPGYGEWFPNPQANCNTPEPCDCPYTATDFRCEACVSSATDGKFCSTIDIAVYTDCIEGAVTGTGYIPSCDPLRVGLRDHMNFRIAYDDGAVQGYFNYSGGQYAGAKRITNAPVKWLLISGVHSWFGGDGWMVHVEDNGKDFRNDKFEVWMFDPVTCSCYHCGGNLVGCYVNISFRYSQQCP